jgi:hypothetical protein
MKQSWSDLARRTVGGGVGEAEAEKILIGID